MSCQKLEPPFTVGDLRPDLVGVFPYDISGHTITLHIRRPSPSTVLVKTVTIVDGPAGEWKVVWSAGDLVLGTNQLCEIQDTDGDGRPLTSEKFLIDVVEQIA